MGTGYISLGATSLDLYATNFNFCVICLMITLPHRSSLRSRRDDPTEIGAQPSYIYHSPPSLHLSDGASLHRSSGEMLFPVTGSDCYTNVCCVSYFTLLSRKSCYRAQGALGPSRPPFLRGDVTMKRHITVLLALVASVGVVTGLHAQGKPKLLHRRVRSDRRSSSVERLCQSCSPSG
jgi:hypothetical protein